VGGYIEENPLANGLVERRKLWTASSAQRLDLVTDPWPWLYE